MQEGLFGLHSARSTLDAATGDAATGDAADICPQPSAQILKLQNAGGAARCAAAVPETVFPPLPPLAARNPPKDAPQTTLQQQQQGESPFASRSVCVSRLHASGASAASVGVSKRKRLRQQRKHCASPESLHAVQKKPQTQEQLRLPRAKEEAPEGADAAAAPAAVETPRGVVTARAAAEAEAFAEAFAEPAAAECAAAVTTARKSSTASPGFKKGGVVALTTPVTLPTEPPVSPTDKHASNQLEQQASSLHEQQDACNTQELPRRSAPENFVFQNSKLRKASGISYLLHPPPQQPPQPQRQLTDGLEQTELRRLSCFSPEKQGKQLHIQVQSEPLQRLHQLLRQDATPSDSSAAVSAGDVATGRKREFRSGKKPALLRQSLVEQGTPAQADSGCAICVGADFSKEAAAAQKKSFRAEEYHWPSLGRAVTAGKGRGYSSERSSGTTTPSLKKQATEDLSGGFSSAGSVNTLRMQPPTEHMHCTSSRRQQFHVLTRKWREKRRGEAHPRSAQKEQTFSQQPLQLPSIATTFPSNSASRAAARKEALPAPPSPSPPEETAQLPTRLREEPTDLRGWSRSISSNALPQAGSAAGDCSSARSAAAATAAFPSFPPPSSPTLSRGRSSLQRRLPAREQSHWMRMRSPGTDGKRLREAFLSTNTWL
ncbi:hypothetical protein cyc_05350 [Cyclospora cayetanensis]|uniref:Uncharacterized protein n=1 Tax=Cyclospora cayetanensis TaxID=88456 RepID=A0A1D3CVG4_9EIME|nr:hypothetical protein cyc_05350 [Cyclospora cayetanensis]